MESDIDFSVRNNIIEEKRRLLIPQWSHVGVNFNEPLRTVLLLSSHFPKYKESVILFGKQHSGKWNKKKQAYDSLKPNDLVRVWVYLPSKKDFGFAFEKDDKFYRAEIILGKKK
jgi:hypothetical protein